MIESHSKRREILFSAREEIDIQSLQRTDGKWLEHLTVQVAPLISEWDICEAWVWDDWSGSREAGESYVNQIDSGIDVVARRRDGKLVAIQCKSRRIVGGKNINSISENECNNFISEIAVDSQLWAERWLVTNGPVLASFNLGMHDLRLLNLKAVIGKQLDLLDDEAQSSRNMMQREAIDACVKGLQKNTDSEGRSRGKLILPCGTGKSRIALRIVEALTETGQFSVVLCPSIALVSQLRREFIEHQANQSSPFLSLAVCSDPGVVSRLDEQKSLADDPTRDITASDINQLSGVDVTTSSEEIADWMRSVGNGKSSFGVIFGTYQSSHKIAEALQKSKSQAQVLIADEAHRTAGLKRVPQVTLERKIRDFTICHDDEKFPTKYRLYQTATPKVYGERRWAGPFWAGPFSEWLVRDMDDQDLFGPELYRRSYLEAVNNGWLSDYRILAIGVNDDEAVETANKCAEESNTQALSTSRLLRGMAMTLVMAGHLREKGVVIKSSINFMNTIALSKAMVKQLSRDKVREWVESRNQHLVENIGSAPPPDNYMWYRLYI